MQKWFRTTADLVGTKYTTSGSIDRDRGAIYGVSVNTVGEAKGHGVWLEQSFVEDVARLGNELKQGLKARFGHPNMCSTALGTFIGRFKNFRVEGNQCIADLYLSNEAKETPHGDLYNYVLGMAENESDMFGTSIVFTVGQQYQLNDDGEKIIDEMLWDDGRKVFVTCDKLHACDVVDDPAANPDGLFSSFNQISLSGQVTEFLDLHPEVYEMLANEPEVVEQFMNNYNNYLTSKKEAEMSKDVKTDVVEELESAETEQVEQLEAVEEVVEETAETVEEATEDAEEEATEEAEVEEVEEEPVAEDVVEEEKELSAVVDPVEAFQALADEHGYEFAKANHGKSEVEILKAVIAEKDAQLATKVEAQGVKPVEFSKGEVKEKLSLEQLITKQIKK
jgi:hypothetical protein